MVRTLKKPELKAKNVEFSESIFRDPKKLEEMKEKLKPEIYISALYSEIYEKERELEALNLSSNTLRNALNASFLEDSERIKKELEGLKSQLAIKRAERIELDKPITDRQNSLDARAISLDVRAKEIDEKEQKVFEGERENEMKLESLKDLADNLGETRTRLVIKEKLILGREGNLKNREVQYLVAVENLNERERQFVEAVKEREYALQLKELNVQSKEENLVKREKELSDGHIWLNDQREVLERAWKEIKKK